MTQFSVLLAVNLAGLAVLFLYIRGRIHRALDSEGLRERLREEIGQLVRELNQTTDRNITLLEDAVRSLKEAVAEADRRAVVLRREAERRDREEAVYDRLGRMRRTGPAGSEGDPSAAGPESYDRPPRTASALDREPHSAVPAGPEPSYPPGRERPSSGSDAGRTVPAPASEEMPPAIPFVTFSSSPLRPKPPLKDEVLSLNRRGISSEFIAAKLGITVAEVELIVSLEEQKGRAGREAGP